MVTLGRIVSAGLLIGSFGGCSALSVGRSALEWGERPWGCDMTKAKALILAIVYGVLVSSILMALHVTADFFMGASCGVIIMLGYLGVYYWFSRSRRS
jgi:hypothetical protein